MKLSLIKGSNASCTKCYYDEDSCPNDGRCIVNDGYWQRSDLVTEDDEIVIFRNDLSNLQVAKAK
jgi:hypothetical protein